MARPTTQPKPQEEAPTLVDEQILDEAPASTLSFDKLETEEAQPEPKPIEQEVVVNKEPMIPLSEVQKLIKQEVEAAKKEIIESVPQQQAPQDQPSSPQSYTNFDLGVANIDGIPELDNWVEKDRVYVLLQSKKAASFGIANRHKPNSPLTYTHPITRATHALRYATNQPSFFVDKQSKEQGSVTIGNILVRGKNLFVAKSNIKLQQFLHIHPHKNIVFKELNPEEDAKKELELDDLKFEAEKLVRQLDFKSQKIIAQLVCPNYNDQWESFTVKKELIKAVPKNAKWIISLAEDDTLQLKGLAKEACMKGFMKYEDYKFIDENDKVLIEVSRTENEWDAISRYFLSSKGRNMKECLEEKLES